MRRLNASRTLAAAGERQRARRNVVRAASVCLAASLSAFGADSAYRQEIEAFRSKREAGLRADGSWLTLVGLHWLQQGQTTFGSDAGNALRLPAYVAAKAGSLQLSGGKVTATVAPGVTATVDGKPVSTVDMRSDRDGPPTVLRLDATTLQMIHRSGKLAVRVKDNRSPKRAAFAGLRWFAIDERLRLDARWVPLTPHGRIEVANITGMVDEMESPGFAEFEWNGATHRLQAVLESPTDEMLFFIFKDNTAGTKTYGAGRFLYAPMPKDGRVVLDFNRAYSPPCAFTSFATCPLPPRQNRLPFAVEAGEMDPH